MAISNGPSLVCRHLWDDSSARCLSSKRRKFLKGLSRPFVQTIVRKSYPLEVTLHAQSPPIDICARVESWQCAGGDTRIHSKAARSHPTQMRVHVFRANVETLKRRPEK